MRSAPVANGGGKRLRLRGSPQHRNWRALGWDGVARPSRAPDGIRRSQTSCGLRPNLGVANAPGASGSPELGLNLKVSPIGVAQAAEATAAPVVQGVVHAAGVEIPCAGAAGDQAPLRMETRRPPDGQLPFT